MVLSKYCSRLLGTNSWSVALLLPFLPNKKCHITGDWRFSTIYIYNSIRTDGLWISWEFSTQMPRLKKRGRIKIPSSNWITGETKLHWRRKIQTLHFSKLQTTTNKIDDVNTRQWKYDQPFRWVLKWQESIQQSFLKMTWFSTYAHRGKTLSKKHCHFKTSCSRFLKMTEFFFTESTVKSRKNSEKNKAIFIFKAGLNANICSALLR